MSGIVKGLFGGKSRAESVIERARPVSFVAPGLRGAFNESTNTFTLSRDQAVDDALSNLTRGFTGRASAFRQLRGRVAPGFGELTQARVRAIRDAGSRTVGSLRDRLRQRRVLGSSFAEREITSTERQFAEAEEEARAEAKVQELGLTAAFIDQEFSATTEAAASVIRQFNIESALAANVSTATQNMLNANAIARGQAASASEGGAGSFLGTIAGALIGLI